MHIEINNHRKRSKNHNPDKREKPAPPVVSAANCAVDVPRDERPLYEVFSGTKVVGTVHAVNLNAAWMDAKEKFKERCRCVYRT